MPRKNIFFILFDNTFPKLSASNQKLWRKARTLATFLSTPKQGKANMQHILAGAWESFRIKRKYCPCAKSYHMDDIIGILPHNNSFIELPGSNLNICKDSINSPGHAKQRDKNMQHIA